jgi:hypothetical protein
VLNELDMEEAQESLDAVPPERQIDGSAELTVALAADATKSEVLLEQAEGLWDDVLGVEREDALLRLPIAYGA